MNVHPPARPRMARISLFGIAAVLMLTGITLSVSSSHSAVKAAIEPPQIDPFSLMANAKNLPSQESLTLKMWPDNGVVRY
jgi:hypothetical protein